MVEVKIGEKTRVGDLKRSMFTTLGVSDVDSVVLLLDDRRCTDIDDVLLKDLRISTNSTLVSMSLEHEMTHIDTMGNKDSVPEPSVPPTAGEIAEAAFWLGCTGVTSFDDAFRSSDEFCAAMCAVFQSLDPVDDASFFKCLLDLVPARMVSMLRTVCSEPSGTSRLGCSVRSFLRGAWAPEDDRKSSVIALVSARGLEHWVASIVASVQAEELEGECGLDRQAAELLEDCSSSFHKALFSPSDRGGPPPTVDESE